MKSQTKKATVGIFPLSSHIMICSASTSGDKELWFLLLQRMFFLLPFLQSLIHFLKNIPRLHPIDCKHLIINVMPSKIKIATASGQRQWLELENKVVR